MTPLEGEHDCDRWSLRAVWRVAWMRMMGAESVAYHQATVLERADDHPGAALAYYASRGETPLRWGGSGAERLGLVGPVDGEAYGAMFGSGGARDPLLGRQLTATRRPGMELVVAAHKSVALLGLMGRAEDLHAIMDAERGATLAYLDDVTRQRGGRRGRAAVPTATSGLVYAHTRHATSRAGDPAPHDHVLLANVVEMLDEQGGWKAADTTLWREHLHAATVIGRMAGARRAVELGYAIEADNGSSGLLGHWRIAGIPVEAEELFSKRAAEIDAAIAERGTDTYQARQTAARTTRDTKRFTPVSDLMTRWQAELASIGLDAEELARRVDAAAAAVEAPAAAVSLFEVRPALDALVAPEGPLARRKVFSRRDVLVALAPALYGHDPSQLERYADWLLTKPDIVPLVGVPGARERAYALASVIAVEAAIADAVTSGVRSTGAALVADHLVDAAVTRREAQLRGPLTDGQEALIRGACSSGRRVEVVLGVAGSGKTTALAGVRDAYQAAGYHVVGTATSGQAARTLGREAGIAESRTVASLLWRLDHGQLNLNDRTLVVLDEAGMTPDGDLLRLLIAANAAGAKVILVGDDRQLGPVGPGGALSGVLERAPAAVLVLDCNIRRHNQGERRALEQLRAGDVGVAADWYATNGRLNTASTRDETLNNLVNAWLNDERSGLNSGLYAWRRANVADLNSRARAAWAAAGRLTGPELHAPGGRRYAAGDRIITLAPAADGAVVTSQRGVVDRVDLDAGRLLVRMDDGHQHTLTGDELGVDRLDHGYAVTVHRAQGATVDVAHRLHDGGGRELAYVAMSRARHHTTIHLVADDLAQALEDLRRDWRDERRPRWAIDTGIPTTHPLAAERDPDTPTQLRTSLRKARLQAERQAIAALIPPDPTRMLARVNEQIDTVRQELSDVERGAGRYADTDVASAAQCLSEAKRSRVVAERALAASDLGWRDRRYWQREVARRRRAEQQARSEWDHVSDPDRTRLAMQLQELEAKARTLGRDADHRREWLAAHPTLRPRLERINTELTPGVPTTATAFMTGGTVRLPPSIEHSTSIGHDL